MPDLLERLDVEADAGWLPDLTGLFVDAAVEVRARRARVAELEAALRGMVTLFHPESDDVDEFPEYRAARRALGADHG